MEGESKDRFDYFCGGLHEAVESFDGFDDGQNSITVVAVNLHGQNDHSFARGTKASAIFSFAMRMYNDNEFLDVIKQSYAMQKKWREEYRQELHEHLNKLQNGEVG